MPFDIGVALRGVFYSWSTTIGSESYGFVIYGAGAFGTIHFSLNSIEKMPAFLKKIDVYYGLGLRFFLQSWTGNIAYLNSLGYNYGGISFATLGGVNYFIIDHLAINIEASYYGYGGFLVGVVYKF
ncbi:MAG: hypothetical protein ACP5QT_02925 [Brevinematia bacterium]